MQPECRTGWDWPNVSVLRTANRLVSCRSTGKVEALVAEDVISSNPIEEMCVFRKERVAVRFCGKMARWVGQCRLITRPAEGFWGEMKRGP